MPDGFFPPSALDIKRDRCLPLCLSRCSARWILGCMRIRSSAHEQKNRRAECVSTIFGSTHQNLQPTPPPTLTLHITRERSMAKSRNELTRGHAIAGDCSWDLGNLLCEFQTWGVAQLGLGVDPICLWGPEEHGLPRRSSNHQVHRMPRSLEYVMGAQPRPGECFPRCVERRYVVGLIGSLFKTSTGVACNVRRPCVG